MRMVEDDDSDESEAPPGQDLPGLQRRASDLQHRSDDATRTYDRTAWIRYAALWVPIPFVVLLLRLHLEAWGYYLLGALFLAAAALIYAVDLAAVAKRDEAIRDAERAQEEYDAALRRIRPEA